MSDFSCNLESFALLSLCFTNVRRIEIGSVILNNLGNLVASTIKVGISYYIL